MLAQNSETSLFSAACMNAIANVGRPENLLIPMTILAPEKGVRYVAVATAGAMLGAVAGYVVGFCIFRFIGLMIITNNGLGEIFGQLQSWFQGFNAVILAAGGFSPLPFSIFTVTSGFFSGQLMTFLAITCLARGARFSLVVWLLWRGGPRYKEWLERNLYGLTMALAVGMMLVAVLVKYIWSRF